MTMTIQTQQVRLERAFETLKNQGITAVLVLSGAVGLLDDEVDGYRQAAKEAGTPGFWVGAHVGVARAGGAYWDADTGQLRLRGGDAPVSRIWFSYPAERADIADALEAALEANAFYTSRFCYNPTADIRFVRLHLREENGS